VELVRPYTNTPGLHDDLARATARILGAKRRPELSPCRTPSPRPPARFVLDRLAPEQVRQIVIRFQAGEPQTKLAADFGMSLSSIKRLLRRHRT
jgi:hypothetical protein